MSLDTALNLAWLSIGIVALLWLAVLECRHHRRSTPLARWWRLVAVLLVTAALFPAVSSSDDLFSFSLMNAQPGRHGSSGTNPEKPNSNTRSDKDKAGLQLVRLLETLEHYQVSGVYTLPFVLSCLTFIFVFSREVVTCPVLCRSGRAPPIH